jgi:hypothetical protein
LKSALSPSWSGVQIIRELGIQCIDHERHGRGFSVQMRFRQIGEVNAPAAFDARHDDPVT